MLPKRLATQAFFPGSEWMFLKFYMGPATAEAWLSRKLPAIIEELRRTYPDFSFHFVRYLDPDFHVRIRINIEENRSLDHVLSVFNAGSEDFIRSKKIWKSEVSTYERETDRYGLEDIVLFEEIFQIDSLFWLKILPLLDERPDGERLRWQLALAGMYQYYHYLAGSPENWLSIIENCVNSLHMEINPSKTLLFQTDRKFRVYRTDLEGFLFGDRLEKMNLSGVFQDRSDLIKSLLRRENKEPDYFQQIIGQQRLTDVVHMSLNRGLRSKHRIQEYILYRYLNKLVRAQF